MKKIIISLSLALITLSSCSSFIEEENLSTGSADAVYKTANGFESLVNANYSQLREIYGNEPWLFVAGTDLYAEGKNLEPIGISQYSTLSPSSPNVGYLYTECFKAIQKANTGLYFSDLTAASTILDARRAELKFLRANAYFLLVQTYGGVPVIKDYSATPVYSYDRNTASEVYDFIEADLKAAIAILPTGTYTGRANKRAAQDLLAKVYLTRGYESYAKSTDFADAATYADAAIGGQALSPFNNTWLPGTDMNPETIFSVQFDPTSVTADPQKSGNAQGSYFSAYLGGAEVAGKAPYKTGTLIPTEYTSSLYQQGDLRWEGTFMTEIYERYYDYYDVADKSTLKVRSFFAPDWYTIADIITYYNALKAAGRKATNFKIFSNKVAAKTVIDATDKVEVTGKYGASSSIADYSGIPIKKFDDPKAPFASSSSMPRVSTRDLIVSRLSDSYLIAAEAYFKSGNTATALTRLNAVRSRSNATAALSSELTIDYILAERAREFMGEYNRWFDLKRTGKLISQTVANHYRIKALGVSAFGTNGYKNLRPIPQDVIDLNQNKNFPQNPGY